MGYFKTILNSELIYINFFGFLETQFQQNSPVLSLMDGLVWWMPIIGKKVGAIDCQNQNYQQVGTKICEMMSDYFFQYL